MITTAFGKRIRELRETLGISQEKFALKIGMDRTYYSSVEAGKRNISIINICKIAKEFFVKLSKSLAKKVVWCYTLASFTYPKTKIPI